MVKKYSIMISLNYKLILLSFFLITFTVDSKTQVDWPFPNQVRGTISGTMGECRGGCNRIHRGTDMFNGGNNSVHSIQGGIGTILAGNINFQSNPQTYPRDAFIRIGNVYYYHIQPANGIQFGTNVSLHDLIGHTYTTVGWSEHLHIQKNGLNYFNGQLSPRSRLTMLSNAVLGLNSSFRWLLK